MLQTTIVMTDTQASQILKHLEDTELTLEKFMLNCALEVSKVSKERKLNVEALLEDLPTQEKSLSATDLAKRIYGDDPGRQRIREVSEALRSLNWKRTMSKGIARYRKTTI